MEVLLSDENDSFYRYRSRWAQRIYFESFTISGSEALRWNWSVEVRYVTVQVSHHWVAFVSDTEQTYDCIVATKVSSASVENMRSAIRISVGIEINLLEDKFVRGRI